MSLKNCGNTKYKGIREPKCNKGVGCDKCWELYDEKHSVPCHEESKTVSPEEVPLHQCRNILRNLVLREIVTIEKVSDMGHPGKFEYFGSSVNHQKK
jgi:hypothetical protein